MNALIALQLMVQIIPLIVKGVQAAEELFGDEKGKGPEKKAIVMEKAQAAFENYGTPQDKGWQHIMHHISNIIDESVGVMNDLKD